MVGLNSAPCMKPIEAKIKIAIVEDDNSIRQGLERMLNRSEEFCCAGSYTSAEAALEGIEQNTPDVALMDINLPKMNGVDCVRQLKPRYPRLQVLMLTVYDNPEQVFEALTAGAVGYLLKQTCPDELLAALRDVAQGGSPMSSQVARKVVQSFHAGAPTTAGEELSTREREVLDGLAKGYLLKEIADQLGVGYDTVRTYVRRIYEKLHVHSRAQAVAKYRQPAPGKITAAVA
jgi:DNA-binding NarL/FixJ family response regulator